MSLQSDFWTAYEQFQSTIDSHQSTRCSLHGHEEALTTILNDFSNNCVSSEVNAIKRRFSNLCTNRTAKYRHRSKLDSLWVDRFSNVESSHNCIERVELQELVNLVRKVVSQTDFQILWNAYVQEIPYREIAACYGMTVANLKSHICRMRKRIRESSAGRVIYSALKTQLKQLGLTKNSSCG